MLSVLAKVKSLLVSQFKNVKNDATILLVFLVMGIASWLPRFRGPIDLRWDAGVYYILGTSLAEGKGYKLLNEPGNIKANQYPPLLPIFVAAHQWVLGTNDPTIVGRGLRLSFFVLFVVYILAIYVLARHYLPLSHAFGVTLVCLFNLYTCFMSDSCLPEIAFALATVLFVLCHNRGGRSFSFMAAAFAVAAYALRTTGVSLLAAWVVEGLLKKEFKRAALRLALLLILVFSWQSYVHAVESEPAYRHPAYAYQRADYLFYNVSYSRNVFLKDPFSSSSGRISFTDLADRCLGNVAQLPLRLGVAVTSDKNFWEAQRKAFNTSLRLYEAPAWMIDVALILLGLIVLGGIGIQLVRREWIIPLYLLFSFAALSIAPWPEQFTRYFAPLTPFLALSLFHALRAILGHFRRVRPLRREVIGAALAGCVMSLILLENGLTFFMTYRKMHQQVTYVDRNGKEITYRLFFYRDDYRALDAGLDWLKQRLKPDEVVASSMPHWVYLRTGLKAVMPPFETDPGRMQNLLDSVPVTFLVENKRLDLDTQRWKLIYSDSVTDASGKTLPERFKIYQRVGPPRTASRDSMEQTAWRKPRLLQRIASPHSISFYSFPVQWEVQEKMFTSAAP